MRFTLSAGFAKYGKARERLVINLGDQKGVAAVILFPHLANLDFSNGHDTNVDIFGGCVNKRQGGLIRDYH